MCHPFSRDPHAAHMLPGVRTDSRGSPGMSVPGQGQDIATGPVAGLGAQADRS